MMHRNHVTNILVYENYCLKAKVQELLERIGYLQNKLLTCHDGGHHSRGVELSLSTIDPKAPTELQEELNKKNIEIEYLKEQIETLSQSSLQAEPIVIADATEKIDISEELKIQVTQLQTDIESKTQTINDMTLLMEEKHKEITTLTTQIEETKKMLSQKEEENENLKTIIAGKDAEIAQLKMTSTPP